MSSTTKNKRTIYANLIQNFSASERDRAGVAQANPQPITISTGSETGLYYVAGNAICQFVNRTPNSVGCKALASDASVDNLNAIANGKREMGIVQSDWQYNAYHGTNSF